LNQIIFFKKLPCNLDQILGCFWWILKNDGVNLESENNNDAFHLTNGKKAHGSVRVDRR